MALALCVFVCLCHACSSMCSWFCREITLWAGVNIGAKCRWELVTGPSCHLLQRKCVAACVKESNLSCCRFALKANSSVPTCIVHLAEAGGNNVQILCTVLQPIFCACICTFYDCWLDTSICTFYFLQWQKKNACYFCSWEIQILFKVIHLPPPNIQYYDKVTALSLAFWLLLPVTTICQKINHLQ